MDRLYSNEIVFRGHPDKVCDQIAGALLNEYLVGDKDTHAGIEVTGGKGKIFITGEVTSKSKVNVKEVVKRVLKDIGYTRKYKIINNLGVQSSDINRGVSLESGEVGAGDQGMMFGYACNDTNEYLPTAMVILQKFAKCYDDIRRDNPNEFYPDGKAQITGVYDENFKLKRIKTFVISYQNSEVNRNKNDELLKSIASNIAMDYGIEIEQFLINPTGRFLIGGFEGDAGVCGRKIVVDAYQSFANVGGGCVDKDTEYLTPYGWKKICDYSKGDLVGQYNNGKLEFVEPISFINTEAEPMFRITSGYLTDMVLSENHNVLLLNKSNKEYKRKFIEILEDWNNKKVGSGLRCAKVPMSFNYDFGNKSCGLSEKELRLMIAFCADGTWYSKPWDGTIHIKKERKKARLRDILKDSGIEYKEIEWNKGSEKGYSSFRIKHLPIKTKRLKDLFVNGISKRDAEIFVDEIFNWDGNCKNLYYSTFKEDADMAQFILSAITGKQVRMYNDGIKYIKSGEPLWYVSLTTTTNPNLFRNNRKDTNITEFIPEDGKMYCINVPSHNLILRRNNKIFVTGNCMNGKDPTKVDMSAAHMARELAKEILIEKKLKWVSIQLSYAIGVAEPVAIYIDSNTGNIEVPKQWYKRCKPKNIIKELNLTTEDYEELAKYGHFTK